MSAPSMAGTKRTRAAAGVRLIVAYKFGKAALQLVAAVVLAWFLLRGGADELREFALGLRQHGVSVWSIGVADLLVTVTTGHRLELTAVALGLDALLSSIEGWSLGRGYAWGPWLIVIATGSLIPFELRELIRHVHLGRALVLVINLLIVAYLARRALHERWQRNRGG